mmetsp:Transcript_104/g.261  ORF Transcript_104/g.261 Transcript_104/m.261 type:complete len:304 (+) Transcript_104:982-1893(+)
MRRACPLTSMTGERRGPTSGSAWLARSRAGSGTWRGIAMRAWWDGCLWMSPTTRMRRGWRRRCGTSCGTTGRRRTWRTSRWRRACTSSSSGATTQITAGTAASGRLLGTASAGQSWRERRARQVQRRWRCTCSGTWRCNTCRPSRFAAGWRRRSGTSSASSARRGATCYAATRARGRCTRSAWGCPRRPRATSTATTASWRRRSRERSQVRPRAGRTPSRRRSPRRARHAGLTGETAGRGASATERRGRPRGGLTRPRARLPTPRKGGRDRRLARTSRASGSCSCEMGRTTGAWLRCRRTRPQ